jgi:hypothetical protein
MASRWSTRLHVAALLVVLCAYAIWSLWSLWSSFGWHRLQVFVGLYASAAVYGVATRQRWARPVVYSWGVLMIIEWLGYTIQFVRAGYPFPDSSWLNLVLAFVPGVLLGAVIGYCCFVVSRYVCNSSGPT